MTREQQHDLAFHKYLMEKRMRSIRNHPRFKITRRRIKRARTSFIHDLLSQTHNKTSTDYMSAFGFDNKPMEINDIDGCDANKFTIVDIDACDLHNELAAVEYVGDIYNFYKEVENECHPPIYMDSQPELDEDKRATLIDCLVSIQLYLGLSQEALYLSVNIVDRFLAIKPVPARKLKLVGVTAMLIAAKYEDERMVNGARELEKGVIRVEDLMELSACCRHDILVMEKLILETLEWSLTVPTSYTFLIRFVKAALESVELPLALPEQDSFERFSFFLAELALSHSATLNYYPSVVAASAVYVAMCSFKENPFTWSETMEFYTGYSVEDIIDCSKLIASFHAIGNRDDDFIGIYEKYETVSAFQAAQNLL